MLTYPESADVLTYPRVESADVLTYPRANISTVAALTALWSKLTGKPTPLTGTWPQLP